MQRFSMTGGDYNELNNCLLNYVIDYVPDSDQCMNSLLGLLMNYETFNKTLVLDCFESYKIPTAELSCMLDYDHYYLRNEYLVKVSKGVYYVGNLTADEDENCNNMYRTQGHGERGVKFMSSDPTYSQLCKPYVVDQKALTSCK